MVVNEKVYMTMKMTAVLFSLEAVESSKQKAFPLEVVHFKIGKTLNRMVYNRSVGIVAKRHC